MDAWYEEEEEEVFVHARDPKSRVNVMPSSRHVRVVIAGQTVAESRRPSLLFETGLPVRYYLPREDVRTDLLAPTKLTTRCRGLLCFFNERVDLYVDGERQGRPRTPWSE